MPVTYGTIQVRKRRGDLVLIGQGKTGRGQSYIKAAIQIGCPSMRSSDFKSKLSDAVKALYQESGFDSQ